MSPKKGRGGRPKIRPNQRPKQRTSFKWTSDMHLQMANYLHDNYVAYKKALSSSRKIHFLRQMRDALNLEADDLQLKNGFINFLRKYDEVKTKLNSSGFGIDPDKESSLNKGWILKVCPYYDILDEVMGCRPNVTPPSIIATGALNTSSSSLPIDDTSVEVTLEELEDAGVEVGEFANVLEESDANNANSTTTDTTHNSNPTSNENDESSRSVHEMEVNKMIKDSFKGLQKKKTEDNPKSAVGIYSKIMSEKLHESCQVEREKLKLSQVNFAVEMDVQKERNQIELMKVNNQVDIENKKLMLESERLEDKKADREHELTKMKMQHDFELKKLELQLKYK